MKHTVGKGHFELALPADWSLAETGDYTEGQIYEDIKSTYSIRNAKGSEMAVLATGIEYYAHGEPPMTQVHNEIIDFSDKASQWPVVCFRHVRRAARDRPSA